MSKCKINEKEFKDMRRDKRTEEQENVVCTWDYGVDLLEKSYTIEEAFY